jgi:WD40 repeat protein
MTIDEALTIIERVLQQGHLTKVQEAVFRQAWAGQSYLEIARTSGYDAGYVKDTGAKLWQQLSQGLGEKVTKQNFQGVLQRSLALQGTGKIQNPLWQMATTTLPPQNSTRKIQLNHDWGDAIDVSIFYGRAAELSALQHWLKQDRCRLVTLLGMGGVGKTALAIKLGETVQQEFEFLIWRSLRDVPTLAELLTMLIKSLAHPDSSMPESISGKLSRLIELLRRSRCLIILDNFDAVLQSRKCAGSYCQGYDDYGELLRRLGEIAHCSCVVLTSREKPQEVGALEGESLPVRTLPLLGLDAIAAQELLTAKGLLTTIGSTTQLIEHYRGNPLALKIAATSIRDLFAGDVRQFLAQGTIAFNGIGNLLEQQCDRLSDSEMQVMDWLAINREPVALEELQADLGAMPKSQLIQVLESLCWRGLIESSLVGLTLQPVVMEHISNRLIDQISQEILTESPQRFLSHALLQAQAKEYIRESQSRVLVQPVLDRLLAAIGSPKQVEAKLAKLIAKLRQTDLPGYGGGNLLNLFRQLETDLTNYDFSQLKIWQAHLQDCNLHHVNFAASEFHNCTFASTFGGITCTSFSATGLLAISDTNGNIQVWNESMTQQLVICKGHNSWVWQVAFSADSRTLVSCGQDHTIRLWEVATGKCLKILQGHSSIVTAIALSPLVSTMPVSTTSIAIAADRSCQRLASSSTDQTIKLWDLATGECLQTLTGHHACVWSVAFAPEGTQLASAAEDNTIKLWDLATGACVQTLTGHQRWVKAIGFSPNGQHLASGSFDHTIKLWHLVTGASYQTLYGHEGVVAAIAWNPDGTTLASGSYDQTVKLWDVQTGDCLKTLQKHRNRVWSVAFHPNGQHVVSGGDDHTARLWNLRTGQCTKTLQGHSNSVYTIAHSAVDRLLVSGHEDQTIKLWHFEPPLSKSLKPFRTLRGHTNRIFSVALGANGLLASCSGDRTIKLWHWQSGDCLHTLQGHKSWVWQVVFHPVAPVLASTSYDHTIKLWDVDSGDCLKTLTGHTSSVLTIDFSPDGAQLVSGGYEQSIKLWDVRSGDCLQTFEAHGNRVWSVVFSPDGQQFASCGDDHTIKLWQVSTGQCLKTLQGHTSQCLAVCFSADGSQLVSCSADNRIRVWDVVTGASIAVLAEHHNWVWSIVLSPDDQMLLSGSQDETIRYWNLATQQCEQTFSAPRPYEGMNISRTTGLTEAQIGELVALGAIAAA